MPRRERPVSARHPRLIAVDLDGTLLDRSGKPHAADLEALQRLAKSGAHVTIVTGRLYSGTKPHAQALKLTGPVACADGSHMVRAGDHATLLHFGLPLDAATKLRDAVKEHAPATLLFTGDAILHDDLALPFLDYVKTWSNDLRHDPELHAADIWTTENALTATVALGTQEQILGVAEKVDTEMPGVQVARFPLRQLPGVWGLIARAKIGTKGTALAWLAEHHGISMDETVCVGDWMNDVPMLEVAGRSFAMGQAPDEVKESATHVLEETYEEGGGIARVVREVFGV